MKFKALRLSIAYLSFFGIFSQRLSERTNEFLKTFNSIFFFFGFIWMVSGSTAYLYYNYTDLIDALNALLALLAGGIGFGVYISLGVNMKTMKDLYNEFQQLINKGGWFFTVTQKGCGKFLKRNNFFSTSREGRRLSFLS